MYLSNFGSTLLTAAMAISFVEASPFELDPRSFSSLSARELTGTSCAPFLYGAKYTEYQKVCISATGSALTITYPNLPSAGNYSDIHVIVQTTPIQEPVQGKWPYGSSAGKTGCQIAGGSATCTIPMQTGWKVCNSQLFIGVHASFSLDGLSGETGWREGTCITDRSNCPRYSTFTTECKCPVVTTYEPYTTSLVYKKTVIETHTVTCSTVPAAATTEATCSDPNAGATKTVAGMTSITDFVCASPV